MKEIYIDSAVVIREETRKALPVADLLKGANGIEIRKQYASGEVDFECCECWQPLKVGISKYGKVFLMHFPNSDYCILKDENQDKELIREIKQHHLSKESPRHQMLKSLLVKKLASTEGVNNTQEEKVFISDGETKRADVYCEFNGLPIAFEVQLSLLSYKYILLRHNFYKRNGIYLFWVLDNFITSAQCQRDKDIKYLNVGENIFELDETDSSPSISFVCNFKKPEIYGLKVYAPWNKKRVELKDLHFDRNNHQVYFFNSRAAIIEALRELDFLKQEKAKEEELRWKRREEYEAVEKEIKKSKKEIEQVSFKIESVTGYLSCKKESLAENEARASNLEEEVGKLISGSQSGFYFGRSYRDNFIRSSEPAESLLSSIEAKTKEIEQATGRIADYQKSLNQIKNLMSYLVNGIQYRAMDPRFHREYILTNLYRFKVVESSSIHSFFPSYKEWKNLAGLESLMYHSEKYLFLIERENEIAAIQEKIGIENENIEQLQAARAKEIEALTGLFAQWLSDSAKDTEMEITKKEEELRAKESEFYECTERIKKLVNKLQVLEAGLDK